MKNRKILYVGLAVLVVAFAAIFFVRLLTPEDTWVCKNGNWIRHGNPTAQMPPVDECK